MALFKYSLVVLMVHLWILRPYVMHTAIKHTSQWRPLNLRMCAMAFYDSHITGMSWKKSSHVATIFSIQRTHEHAICYSESIFHSLIQVLIQLVTIVHNLDHPF
jgi:hypothetical protein